MTKYAKSVVWSGLCVALVLPAAAGCPPKPPPVVLTTPQGETVQKQPAASASEEEAARKLFNEAAALQAANPTEADKKRDDLVKRYPTTLAAAETFEARAKLATEANKTAEALLQYEHLLFYRPDFSRADAAREQYAALLLEAGRFDDAEKNLGVLYTNASTAAAKQRLGDILVEAQSGAGHTGAALEVLIDLSNAAGVPEPQRRELQDRAVSLVSSNLSFTDAETVWSKGNSNPRWTFLQPVLAYKLAKIYYHTRDYNRSEDMLNLIGQRFPQSAYAASAHDFLDHLKARFEVEPHAVGVVLPLTGKFKQYGERSLAAIQMAFGPHSPIHLAVKDSQGEPNIAAQAVETLVLENHVIGVLGPMFSNEAMAAALKAEELQVPLIALSHRDGLPELGPFVFRTALTVTAQAKALAKVAFEELGFSRFALLYPKSRYGIDFIAAFWDEVDRRRGEIRGAEAYEPDQTTFREPVRRLIGHWYLGARSDFREAMDNLRRAKLSPLRMRSEIEKLDKGLPPVVDFDAIIIPDSGRQIGLIAPALAFEDIVLTHDPKTLDKIRKANKSSDVHPVTLLGASTWNSAQTLESCESYCEDAVFVDAYFANSPDAKVRDFIAAFRETNGGAEPLLPEAQAFDTAGLLKNVLTAGKPATRKALREQLGKISPYPGITGKMTFDNEGDAQKDLFVLTIKEHTIRLYERSAEPPRG